MRKLLSMILACLASTSGAQTPPASCPPMGYQPPDSGAPRLMVDVLEGQVLVSHPVQPARLGSMRNVCIALFDQRTQQQVANTTSGEDGRFTLANPRSGDFTLIATPLDGRRGPMRVSLHLSGAATGTAASRGLLLWPARNDSKTSGQAEVLTNLVLRRELLDMNRIDQAIRMEMIDKGMAEVSIELAQRAEVIDRQTHKRLLEIVHQHGWPTIDKVGLDGAAAASTMLQHVPYETQKEFLPLVEAGLRAGKVEGSNYALLVDRIRDNEGRPELYGGGAKLENGRLVFHPIEDAEHVDERRAALGMVPLAEYREMMQKVYFPEKTGGHRAD